jgi:hypothetical protein
VIVKMIVEKQMKCRLAGETEVLEDKPAPAPFLPITKSHMTRPGFEPWPPRWKMCGKITSLFVKYARLEAQRF